MSATPESHRTMYATSIEEDYCLVVSPPLEEKEYEHFSEERPLGAGNPIIGRALPNKSQVIKYELYGRRYESIERFQDFMRVIAPRLGVDLETLDTTIHLGTNPEHVFDVNMEIKTEDVVPTSGIL